MGVQRDGIRGRLLIIPEISMIVSYWVEGSIILIMRHGYLHKLNQIGKQKLYNAQRPLKGLTTLLLSFRTMPKPLKTLD